MRRASQRQRQSLQAMEYQCSMFNRAHPVGSFIRVWTGLMGDGPGRVVRIGEPGAYVLSGHTAVAQIAGGGGCIALSHTKPLAPGELEAIHAG